MLDIDAADAAFNYVSEDLPGADVIRHEYECIKEAKAAIDSGDYVSAVEIYEELGGSYAGLAMDTYKDAAEYPATNMRRRALCFLRLLATRTIFP